jgi:serine phosphatase RsbU (regulator of sigma subunit)
LWIIRKGESGITEIKATKSAIGGLTSNEHVFEKHAVNLAKGDSIYIFSDGYADQFGAGGKKMMVRRFKDNILSLQSLSMAQQKEKLASFLDEWMGSMEQTDDILVIGVKV